MLAILQCAPAFPIKTHYYAWFYLPCVFSLFFSGSMYNISSVRRISSPGRCVACNTSIAVKHILIECADLLEVRNKYFKERSLCSLFRNVNPEKKIDYLKKTGMFYKV